MAHWAQINNNNTVLQVLVMSNDIPDEGYQWLVDNLGGRWIKTSYNNNIRKIFAQVGGQYDETNDRFLPAKREGMESYIFDEESYTWIIPVPYPTDKKLYAWDEPSVSWIEISKPVLPTE
jgi:hypothetical protein